MECIALPAVLRPRPRQAASPPSSNETAHKLKTAKENRTLSRLLSGCLCGTTPQADVGHANAGTLRHPPHLANKDLECGCPSDSRERLSSPGARVAVPKKEGQARAVSSAAVRSLTPPPRRGGTCKRRGGPSFFGISTIFSSYGPPGPSGCGLTPSSCLQSVLHSNRVRPVLLQLLRSQGRHGKHGADCPAAGQQVMALVWLWRAQVCL